MDILSLFLQRLGFRVYEHASAPAASNIGTGDAPINPETVGDSPDPTDSEFMAHYDLGLGRLVVHNANLDMVLGSQPSQILAVQSPSAAPSAYSPLAVPLYDITNSPAPNPPPAPQSPPKMQVRLFNQLGLPPGDVTGDPLMENL